ncbi:molybdate ABC transporter substrate-binding protein [Spirulina subsalsa]|uniref:molybdate ABC transporter substrate-binding protein n=1 Tax=Spirulina TaxID=1154 RepID=UPI00232D1B55|nr:molybdate ABC transporter substrate-binding protein [Spirulina subsalsa]
MKQGQLRTRSHLRQWLMGVMGLCLLILGLQGCPQSGTTLLVGAASSLTDVLEAITPAFHTAHPTIAVNYNFAASGKLTQQIQQGAPLDLFISAAPHYMDQLERNDQIHPDSRRPITQNRLVLIVPSDRPILTQLTDLTQPEIQRIAVGDFRTVPAGQYTQAMLTTTQLLPTIQEKLVFGQNVRQVLAVVAAGNADAGIVYRSDVQASDAVRIAFTLDPATYPEILYPAAILTTTRDRTAAATYLDFLLQPDTQRTFQRYGFMPLPGSDRPS